MKSLLADLKGLIVKLVDKLANEPVVVTGAIVAAIVWVAGHFGVVLDKPTLTAVLAPIVAAICARFTVTPTRKLRKQPLV